MLQLTSASSLLITRVVPRHWRYISSFHGPWLQLPPDVLESLAYSNNLSPRPHPIYPAVFFDLVKVRKLIEEATNLAVCAANGTTSSSLSASQQVGNGISGGGSATALGIGLGGSRVTAKLSRERKHRMRESATQKLSEAYQLDEIAASVATMQSASSLEDVAKLVLQRNSKDIDAKYVHFFHEKIPSRMLAQSTSLEPLNDVIKDRPTDGAPIRTRAVTKIFKDDLVGAVKDLTEALTVCRRAKVQHTDIQDQLELVHIRRRAGSGGVKISGLQHQANAEEKKPNSLEPQLLFHRAGVYLALACENIHSALGRQKQNAGDSTVSTKSLHMSDAEDVEITQNRIDAHKLVKTYAKRALRDYTLFLSNFDYSPGQPSAIPEDFFWKVNATANGKSRSRGPPTSQLLEMSGNSNLSKGCLSDDTKSASTHEEVPRYDQDLVTKPHSSLSISKPEVYKLSTLFSSSPPGDLPPYPAMSQALVSSKSGYPHSTASGTSMAFLANSLHEAVTYHPLLTDALHSLLLCHSLIQTSPKEHLRHAHMVARLARVCDGYPVFLAARSPSRADWTEVIRRTNNRIGLQQSWETLCAPAPLPGQIVPPKKETEQESRERRHQEAIMEALADERVHDEVSFQAVVAAREKLAEDQQIEELTQDNTLPKRWAQSDGMEYPISTERAEAISIWVRDAALGIEEAGQSKRNERTSGHEKRSSCEATKTPLTAQIIQIVPEDKLNQITVDN